MVAPLAPLPAELQAYTTDRISDLAEQLKLFGLNVADRDESSFLGALARVWALSDFVANSCVRHPDMLRDLVESGDLTGSYKPNVYRQRTTPVVANVDNEQGLMKALREWRRRELVRIAWRDLIGAADLQETVRDTTEFADTVIDTALSHLYVWHCRRFGRPQNEQGEPQSLVVLGLGKLGAEELNFSSDVDLMFAYPEGGQTVDGTRSVTNDRFFLQLARRLVHMLGHVTEDGFIFRVDTRLRPFGGSGPLVMSFNAIEDYYQSYGREWERCAFTRARVVAGDKAQGQRLLDRLQPFVYRRYLDFGAVQELREMKALLSREVVRKGLQDNIKTGPGGIREIEFLCQAFQLIRGGQELQLRERNVVSILTQLGTKGYLPADTATELRDAYRFLRNTEHRLQEFDDRQTHSLPQDSLGKLRLAIGMGFGDWEGFIGALGVHRGRVQAHFDKVFAAPEEKSELNNEMLQGLWTGAEDPEQAAALLAGAGFENGKAAWERLDKLRNASSLQLLSKRGHQRLQRLMPLLLVAVGQQGGLTETLERVLNIIEAIASRSVYLALLVEHPVALDQLVRLCKASPWITRQIARHPLLLDELLDPRTLYAPPTRTELETDVEGRLKRLTAHDTEREMETLRQFKQANVLRIAAADISDAMPLMVVSDHLTAIAEVSLQTVLRIAWRDLVLHYGQPQCCVDGQTRDVGFAIVGYGKLGGLELGYGSDLDIVFVHDGTGTEQHTQGPKSVDNGVFFSRLARRVIHFLSAHTAAGTLYEVDARLRPSGASGLLVSSTDAFREYQLHSAWTWEHQALVRARVVAGPSSLRQWFEKTRQEILRTERDAIRLRQDVCAMRERMLSQLNAPPLGSFDLKQGQGSIADIEFMVQYATLRWPARLGKHLKFTDNIRLLDGLATTGVLSAQDARCLAEAYRGYRQRVHALALQEQLPIVSDLEFRDKRATVKQIWQRLMEA